LSTGHSVLKNSLHVILTETEGASQAWKGLFAYFCSLCQALNPKLSFPRKGGEAAEADTTNDRIGVSSILFALISSPDDTERLFEIAMLLMEDDGDLGMYTWVSIPISLHVRNITKFIELMLQKVSDGKTSQVFIQNAMKILRGLADRKNWTSPMINVNTFAPLFGQLVDPMRAVRGRRAFIPTTMEGTNYVIETTNAESLYEGIMTMIKRNKTLDSLTNRVQIDTSTLQ
jgi:hypothetical protein